MTLPYPRLDVLRVRQVEHITGPLEHGVLYVSKRFKTAIHLCACGCGMKTVTPEQIPELPKFGWVFTGTDDSMTIRPSILNRLAVCPSAAHYYVTENRIEWLP